MPERENLYSAPEAEIKEDFIAYEPIHRPMLYTVAGSLCWFFAALVIFALGINIPVITDMVTKTGWTNLCSTRSERYITIIMVGSMIITPILIFAGHSFLKRRGRRGLILGLMAFGVSWTIGALTDH